MARTLREARSPEEGGVVRRLLALLAGICAALAVVVATFVVLPAQSEREPGEDFGYVYSGTKSSSVAFVRACLEDEGSLLVLGSSEFSTPERLVSTVPRQTFGAHNHGIRPMLVGEAFDQCLWHAMALGALADGGLPGGKVVLVVSLGQYADGGVDAATFGERFSYTLYQGFCNNDRIGEATRAYVRARLEEQGIDDMTIRAGAPSNLVERIDGVVLGAMDDLRLRRGLMDVRRQGMPVAAGPEEQPAWDELRTQALVQGQAASSSNSWGVEDGFYQGQLAPSLDAAKGARAQETYQSTPEYDDLACFLDVCDACGVVPLVVVQPVLGPYYDHIGITRQTREAAYERIRSVVAAHPAARIADFSGHEYEPCFLYDIVHFGWTGWIDAERAIYEFAREGSV